MTDDFPKNRGGWSGPGRTAATRLGSEGDQVWLRQRRFGAEARNKGGHLTVSLVDQAARDAWYSLGTEGSSQVLRGSSTARGEFVQRPTPPSLLLTAARLFPRGDGSAFAMSDMVGGGFVDSVFGPDNREFPATYYITRGRTAPPLRPALPMIAGRVTGLSTSRYTRPNVFPASSGTRRDGIYEHAICYSTIVSGQHVVAVTFDDGTAQRHTVAASATNQMIFPLAFERLGPSTYIGLAGTYIVSDTQAPPGYIRALAPSLFFFYTTNAGATWARMVDPALLAHERATHATISDDPALTLDMINEYNDMNSESIVRFVPLSRTRAFVWALLGSYETEDSLNFYKSYRVRYGVADLLTGSVSLEGTLYDPPYVSLGFDYYAQAYPRWDRTPVMAPGGGVLVQYVDADYPANWTTQPQLFRTETGVLEPLGVLPFQAGKTGIMTAVSGSKLFMPAYDTEHSLFESSNLGLTWTKRARISDNAAPPAVGAQYTATELASFQGIAWLRDEGQAQNATPAAPWLSDDRITPP